MNLESSMIAGYPILRLTQDEAIEFIKQIVEKGQGGMLVTLNLDMVSRAANNAEYAKILLSADHFIADGMPLVWASKWKRRVMPLPMRVTGTDTVRHITSQIPAEQLAILGGLDPETGLKALLGDNASKVYVDSGMFKADEETADRVAKELNDRGIRIAYVCLGEPKQTLLSALLRTRCPHTLFIGLGSALDFPAGKAKRAPVWVQKIGMEWCFRLLSEPKRLWRRYLVDYWPGVWAVTGDVAKSYFRAG